VRAVIRLAGLMVLGAMVGCGGQQDATAPQERRLTADEQKAVDAVVASARRDEELYRKALEAPERAQAARVQDAYRRPGDLLTLLRVEPGMTIADASGSDAYMGDVLAGLEASGVKVARVGSNAASLAALEPGSVDAVLCYLAYHEWVAMEADRAAWLAAAKRALRPNGALLVVDYAADPGTAGRDAKDLGRIDEQLVRQEAEAAGFDVEEFNGMFRNPADDHRAAATSVQPAGSADQFAIRFRRLPE